MKILKDAKDYYIIKKSGLFDSNWFKDNYNLSNDVNPIKYYLKYYIKKNLNPSKDFDTLWYLNEYDDVKNSEMHPFVHYIRHGINEHRLSKPLFAKNTDRFSLINQDYNHCFLNNTFSDIDKNEVNVGIFLKNDVENLLPTEYIRVVIPLYHLFLEKNFKPYIIRNNDLLKKNFRNIDIVVVQRDALDLNVAKLLVDISKANNIKLIYDIDDDLLGIDENHPNYNEFIRKKDVIKFLISNSDVVTVSTEYLKEKVLSLNSNIKVIKNSLNDMLNLSNNVINSDSIKIGYMGTLTHKNDVKIIEKAIENVKDYFSKKGKEVIFETVGVSDEKIDCANPINIPFKYSKYPYFIRWLKRITNWDIALAPLENTEINKSKSEVKYLEYTSLGIPGIYSNIGAYSKIIENNKNGILIESNSVEEWESAIISLIDNVELQKRIVKNAKKDIEKKYSIELMVNSWSKLFEELLNKNKLIEFSKDSLKFLTNFLFNKEYFEIAESRLFNKDEYPIVHQDPIYHFLSVGVFEGYSPLKAFNCQNYAKLNNIDIKKENPFVHFIMNHANKFKFNYLTNENIVDICLNLERKVSIIIPIYNAYEDTKRCIESVLKYSKKNFELILINDDSTDSRIGSLLEHYEDNPNIKIIHNPVNVGFVSSINIGLKNSIFDVILLNSDVLVTPKWIEKLICAAYSDEMIATVTPFSNNAGVFSVPKFNKKNIISKDLGLIGASNIVEKASNHVYMKVPTGHGFCLYIKRNAINSVGYFDDETFDLGYGEENDFCLRVKEKGWENIIDDSTYIFHNGSSSFGCKKQQLIDKHMKLLNKKYPSYVVEVNKFINSKKFKNMINNVDNALNNMSSNKRRVLYINNMGENIVHEGYENYLLKVENNLILYYSKGDSLFKIKEVYDDSLDEFCFNIIINLSIDDLRGDFKGLDKSHVLMSYFNKYS